MKYYIACRPRFTNMVAKRNFEVMFGKLNIYGTCTCYKLCIIGRLCHRKGDFGMFSDCVVPSCSSGFGRGFIYLGM